MMPTNFMASSNWENVLAQLKKPCIGHMPFDVAQSSAKPKCLAMLKQHNVDILSMRLTISESCKKILEEGVN